MNLQEHIDRIKEVMNLNFKNDFIFENKKLLNEEVEGIDAFILMIVSYYDVFKYNPEWSAKIKEFIEKSGCQKIEFSDFQYPSLGVALMNGVLINKKILGKKLGFLLYVIFHEIAHQFQFKKYGANVLYNVYYDESNIDDAAKYIYEIELIADEFASRKVREFVKLGIINKNYVAPQIYKKTPVVAIKNFIEDIRTKMKKNFPEGNMSNEQIAEFIYNMVKLKTTNNK